MRSDVGLPFALHDSAALAHRVERGEHRGDAVGVEGVTARHREGAVEHEARQLVAVPRREGLSDERAVRVAVEVDVSGPEGVEHGRRSSATAAAP